MNAVDFFIVVLTYLVVLGIGIAVGLMMKGININITHSQEEKEVIVPQQEAPKEYNTSTYSELPDDVRNYYEKNKGFIE